MINNNNNKRVIHNRIKHLHDVGIFVWTEKKTKIKLK